MNYILFFIKNNVLSLAFIDTETNELCFHANSVTRLNILLKKQKYKLTEKQILCANTINIFSNKVV